MRSPEYKKAQRLCVAIVAQAECKGLLPLLSSEYVPCVDCGDRAVGYEHRDYSKPLEVEPVCSRCNNHRGAAVLSGEVPSLAQWKSKYWYFQWSLIPESEVAQWTKDGSNA